jgi:hypothetical protein
MDFRSTRILLTGLARAYSVMPFIWSIGTIIGPFIGGTFANPAESFPDKFPKHGLFGRFPYLLPNLICAALLLGSIVLAYYLLEETHPDMQPRILLPDDTYVSAETSLVATADATNLPTTDPRAESYGTFDNNLPTVNSTVAWKDDERVESPPIFTKRIIALIIALGIFSYHSMTYDHLLPILLEEDRSNAEAMLTINSNTNTALSSTGGLGLSLRNVGVIMSINGIIAVFVQVIIFPLAAAKVGVSRLFFLVMLLQPIAYVMMPYLVCLPEKLMYPGIYACLTIRNILQIIAYPLILILIKDATPSKCVLGKVNGLAASVGAACRTVAPPVAGYLYTIGSKFEFTALAWYGSTFVAIIGAVQCLMVQREKVPGDVEHKSLEQKEFVPQTMTNEDHRDSVP